VKANRGQIEKLLDAGGGAFPVFLLYGPDESGSRALMARLVRVLGAGAEKIEIDGTALKADPARLADEAAALSLFGDKRLVVATIHGDEAMAAITTLLASVTIANPVVIIGGALKGTSAVVKALLAHPKAQAFASYPLDERALAELASAMARERGLRIDGETARTLAALSGLDRAVLESEVEKLALYCDADPTAPKEAGRDAVDAIGADAGEPELAILTDAAFGGRPDEAADQLARLRADNIEGIVLLRALTRRAQQLVKLQGEMAGGKSVDAVTASLFFKEKGPVTAQLRRWSPDRLARASDRLLAAERAIKASGSAGPIMADATILDIARAARR
jgi:DNA polymerase III subunit delta